MLPEGLFRIANFRNMIDLREDILLIAEPFLKDENFMRTVIYICKHSDEGSFGFIVNRVYEHTLDELIAGLEGTTVPVFAGGPVQKDTIHFLHQYPDLIPGCYQVSADIYWGGDFEAVKALLCNNQLDMKKIKFFIGYSGWDKAQLESEMKENSWLAATATREIIFELPHNQVWKESIRHLGGKYRMMVNFPIDPQLN